MTLKMVAPLEVGVAVRDLPGMRDFYERVLGFAFVSEIAVPARAAALSALNRDGYNVVRLQTPFGERIKLLAPAHAPATKATPGYILDEGNATYLTFIVEDLQAVIDNLFDAGVEFLTGTQRVEVRQGTYLAFCRDPEGNVLEFVQYADIAGYRPDLHHTRNT